MRTLSHAATEGRRALARHALGAARPDLRAGRTVAGGAARRARSCCGMPTSAVRSPAIAQPALVVSGDRDTLALPGAGRFLAERCRMRSFALIAGRGAHSVRVARRRVRRGARRLSRCPLSAARRRSRRSGRPRRPSPFRARRRDLRRRRRPATRSLATDGRAPRGREARSRGHSRRRLWHGRRAGRSRAALSGRLARSRWTWRCRCFARGDHEGGGRRSTFARLLSAFGKSDSDGGGLRLRGRRRIAASPPADSISPGATWRCNGWTTCRGRSRNSGACCARAGSDVLDVRSRTRCASCARPSPAWTGTAMSAGLPTCMTSATCWSARASAIR